MIKLPSDIFIKKLFDFFLSCKCSFQIWALKPYNQDISKIIVARSFKFGKLIENDE